MTRPGFAEAPALESAGAQGATIFNGFASVRLAAFGLRPRQGAQPAAIESIAAEVRPWRSAARTASSLSLISTSRLTPMPTSLSASASRRLRALAGPSAWLAASVLLAWAASDIFWRLAGQAPVLLPMTPDTDPRAAAQRIASHGPFAGQALPSSDPVAGSIAPAPVFRVQGLATGFADGPGFALVSAGDGPVQAVAVGEEIAPGIWVRRIASDSLELEQGGRAVVVRLHAPASDLERAIAPVELAQEDRTSELTSPGE